MHAAEAVSSPLSIISQGDVGGDGAWRCDRSSYKRSSFSTIRDSLMHYLTGPETTETPPVTVSDLCGIEPLRDGQALARGSRWPPPWGLPSKGLLRQKTPNLAQVQEPYMVLIRVRIENLLVPVCSCRPFFVPDSVFFSSGLRRSVQRTRRGRHR